jgi:hypothetical protein
MSHSLAQASVTPLVPTTGGVTPAPGKAAMDQITPPDLLAPRTPGKAGRLRRNLGQNLGQAVVVLGLALTVLWLGAMALGFVMLLWNAV